MKFKYIAIAVLMPLAAFAQAFSSGSTGIDGALNFSTPGTYVFDPKSYTPALNAAGDGIFNFTTITIGANVTVKLVGTVFNAPVVWLAQGAVKIDGTIDLSGQDGFSATSTTQRTLTIPRAGGYAGGYPAVGSNPDRTPPPHRPAARPPVSRISCSPLVLASVRRGGNW